MISTIFRSIFTIILCAITVGHVPSMIPYYAKAKNAANRVFHLFQSIPEIDSYSDAGKSPVSKRPFHKKSCITQLSRSLGSCYPVMMLVFA